ncbi:aminoglycoside phosphotransferase family protein [Roseibium sp. MMSF_3544]|uniref:aminoglycoside phosphotransferase family protein n=1 Tax=unclassified Roseibium TaxID=2629323 RepID=UPI00273E1652|nr:aminoglycoside phosphotransferase family protein [Roseibium sp. MMSF_3544]
MHANEIISDEAVAARLIEEQVPALAGLPVRRVESSGTDNALYRIGDDHVIRLPRRPEAVPLLTKEITWLPLFKALPLEVPRLVAAGRPSGIFGHAFGVFRWISGVPASNEAIGNMNAAARDLAGFLRSLRAIETAGAPQAGDCNHHRGVVLEELDDKTRRSIHVLTDEIDVAQALSLWQDACSVPFEGPGSWLHGDLKADNLLARNGRLRAVIDWGLCAVGDPSADYCAAWSFVSPEAQSVFRETAEISDTAWLRAKGWALYGAVIALSYYRGGKNEPQCRQSRQTLSRLGLLRGTI